MPAKPQLELELEPQPEPEQAQPELPESEPLQSEP